VLDAATAAPATAAKSALAFTGGHAFLMALTGFGLVALGAAMLRARRFLRF
jgi:hypothetical protein